MKGQVAIVGKPLLLVVCKRAAELDVPADNIFNRLIRNPRPDSPNPKERECTEMLCSVLNNAPAARRHILGWMAGIAGIPEAVLDDLTIRADTEQPTNAGKRDDLRVHGWASSDQQRQVVLWTIEVKVGSPFTMSSAATSADVAVQGEFVNQLVNYDAWLLEQDAEHRRGFVLALTTQSDALPQPLKCQWHCISWTRLGIRVKAALDAGAIPANEQVLARHLWGFIREHLWRGSEMPNARLNFDDIALMRAVHMLGEDCAAKAKELGQSLIPVLRDSGVGVGEVEPQFRMDMPTGRQWSLVHRNLLRGGKSPTIEAGIVDGDAVVFIEAHVADESKKRSLLHALNGLLPTLRGRNPAWTVPAVDEAAGYWNVELTMPLTELLTAPDQKEALAAFVVAGLGDLKASGVVKAFEKVFG